MNVFFMWNRKKPVRWVVAASKTSLADAEDAEKELGQYGVNARTEKVDGRWVLFTPPDDRDLARGLCGELVDVREPAKTATPSRPRFVVPVFASVLGLGVGLSTSAGLSSESGYWTASAYHSDDNGDGAIDRVVAIDDERVPVAVAVDRNHDGVFDRFIHFERATGVIEDRRDDDDDGAIDQTIRTPQEETTR
ncbi:MAG: hypothetical protein AAF938_05445 [Myxococcota bacterium]